MRDQDGEYETLEVAASVVAGTGRDGLRIGLKTTIRKDHKGHKDRN